MRSVILQGVTEETLFGIIRKYIGSQKKTHKRRENTPGIVAILRLGTEWWNGSSFCHPIQPSIWEVFFSMWLKRNKYIHCQSPAGQEGNQGNKDVLDLFPLGLILTEFKQKAKGRSAWLMQPIEFRLPGHRKGWRRVTGKCRRRDRRAWEAPLSALHRLCLSFVQMKNTCR